MKFTQIKIFGSALIIFLVSFEIKAAKIVSTVYPTTDIVVVDYDVTDFGADNSGIYDATIAVQKTIDSCYSAGGGTVWMPAGTYKISNTVFVRSFVTLRGDWRDPDVPGSDYGTLIRAEVAPGDDGPVLFQIGGSAGVMGVTVFYPDQDINNPVPYNYTFNLGYWTGQRGTYMASNLISCTMLNSYRGIGKNAVNKTKVTEISTIRNIKGTALLNGVSAYNSADVGTWSHINFNNSYWANAGSEYNAPLLSDLNAWTKMHGTAFIFGDLEWDQFYDINCSDYSIGIHIVRGARATFCGEFLYSRVANCYFGVVADVLDNRWGAGFIRCDLSGNFAAVANNSNGYIKLTDCTLSGPVAGTVQVSSPETTPANYEESSTLTKVSRAILYDVTRPPYNAPFKKPQTGLPVEDATLAVQAAIDSAGRQGGGVVYLPAGWYKVNSHINIHANVELRGCSSVPQLDEGDLSYGTTLMLYEGRNTANPEIDTAAITLSGDGSGVNGIRFVYPENNHSNGIVPYPFTICGKGAGLYLLNLGLTGIYNVADFASFSCDRHLIRNVSGSIYNKGFVVSNSGRGWIENCLTNPGKAVRCNYNIPGWYREDADFQLFWNSVIRVNSIHIIVKNCVKEQILNCFSYAANTGLHVYMGKVQCYNFGTDNVGAYSVISDCGSDGTEVMNLMRYNGTSFSGRVKVFNEMHLSDDLNPPNYSMFITSIPKKTGVVGSLYSYVIRTSGATKPEIIVTGNPSWLILKDSLLSGFPPYAGIFGPVKILVSDSSSCLSSSQTFTIDCNAINVYPNPVRNVMYIESENSSPRMFSIFITNCMGQSILDSEIILSGNNSIDISNLSSGIYFLRLKDDRDCIVNKFEVQE